MDHWPRRQRDGADCRQALAVDAGLGLPRPAILLKRRTGMDPGAPSRLGVDGEGSVHQFQPLFHADETEPVTDSGLVQFKALAGIAHLKVQGAPGLP